MESTPSYVEFESVLRRQLPSLEPDEKLGAQASLFELGLDSMKMIELVTILEQEFHLEFPAELLAAETFATPAALWERFRSLDSNTES